MNKLTGRLTATTRITAYYALSLTLLLVILSGATVLLVRFYQNQGAKASISSVETAITGFITDNKPQELSAILQNDDGIYVSLSKDGTSVYASPDFPFSELSKLPDDRFRSFEDDDENDFLLFKKQLHHETSDYELILIKDMQTEKDFLLILFFIMLAIDVAGLIISVAMGILMAKQVLKPVKALAGATKKINSDNLSGRLPMPLAKDEIYQLTKSINEMSERLELSFNRQKQFVSDASHELRTPLASIKGYASLISRWGKNDMAALEKSVNSIMEETEYMSVLIDKLLFLAKMDKRAAQLAPCDLSQIVCEVCESLRVYSQGYNIECDCPAPVNTKTDKALVLQLLRILTDNALKFTPAGGTISLSCKSIGSRSLLWVADTGCGIAPENQPKIFDRFYTESSSRSKDYGGNGLGLAIAKSICTLLRADIGVESQPQKGTKFNVIFH